MFKLNFENLNFYRKCRSEHIKLARCVHSVVNFSYSRFDSNRVLRDLSKSGRIDEARQLFDEITDRDEFTWNTMIAAYANSGKLSEAKRLFDETPYKSCITWSSLISGYCQCQREVEAFELFWRMRFEGHGPSQYTLGSVLRLCSSMVLLQRGEQIHALGFGEQVHGCVIRGGLEANAYVQSALVSMYVKCRDLNSGRSLLLNMSVDDVVSWNSMIVGCVRQGFEDEALSFFKQMHAREMKIDAFTYPSVLNCFTSNMDMKNAKSVHCLIIKTGFEAYKLVNNALVDMYAKRGSLGCAFMVFNHMQDKDVISWTSLVTGCAHNGSSEEALKYFCDMRIAGICPDQIVVASILSACAELTLLELGRQVHATFLKFCLGSSLSVGFKRKSKWLFDMQTIANAINETSDNDILAIESTGTDSSIIIIKCQNGR
ncbi:hypothetical protein QYF36_025997 [Acer negundo]|nr:hypothetical protein QYF36_025997 [Acer negundo]